MTRSMTSETGQLSLPGNTPEALCSDYHTIEWLPLGFSCVPLAHKTWHEMEKGKKPPMWPVPSQNHRESEVEEI